MFVALCDALSKDTMIQFDKISWQNNVKLDLIITRFLNEKAFDYPLNDDFNRNSSKVNLFLFLIDSFMDISR